MCLDVFNVAYTDSQRHVLVVRIQATSDQPAQFLGLWASDKDIEIGVLLDGTIFKPCWLVCVT